MPVEARDALLAKVMTAAAQDGLADRSLREIAATAGTSHRMLIYHFGSREGLLAQVVARMEAAQRDLLADLAGAPGSAAKAGNTAGAGGTGRAGDIFDVSRAFWERVT